MADTKDNTRRIDDLEKNFAVAGQVLNNEILRNRDAINQNRDAINENHKLIVDNAGGIRSLELSMATLTERVKHLPSKGFIVVTVTLVAAIFSAITLLQDQIMKLLN